jgi:hypothetical protein
MKNDKPILVTGSHRSGTTWIGRTISQHAGVRYVHEPFNVDYPNKDMGLELDTWFSRYQSSNQKEKIYTSFNNLLKSSPLEYAVEVCKKTGINAKTPMLFGKHFLSELFARPRILVKDPIALLSAGWLYETYDFQVIVMIRNPFAFVGSLKIAGWDFDFENLRKQKGLMAGPLNQFAEKVESMCAGRDDHDLIDRAALLWNILHFVILEYQSKYQWLFVKHEDISINPESGFRQIFDYLGLEMNSKILKYIESYTTQKYPEAATSTNYQPRDSKLCLHTWKNRLSDEEIERVNTATSDIASIIYDKI